MAFTGSLPTIWSQAALIQLEKELIFASPLVCNHDYEGEIQDRGNAVKVHGVNDPLITPYVQDTVVTAPDVLTDFEVVLNINQADKFNFAIDDIQDVQMLPKLMPQAIRRAAYKLANAADVYVAGQIFAAAGTTSTDTNWTSTAVLGSAAAPSAISPAAFSDPTSGEAAYEFLVDLAADLDAVAVPREGRYVIVPPWFVGLLNKDLRFTGYPGYGGSNTVLTDGFAAQAGSNGLAGRVSGFNVIMSLNIPTGTFTTPTSNNPYSGNDGASQTYYKIIAGVPSAATFANQIIKMETFRNPNYFANQVRGLHVYGFKTIWPERLVGAYIAQGAATTH